LDRSVAGVPPTGLAYLAGAVLLLGSAWPLTKQAVSLGASPLWIAEGRAALSGVTAFAVLGLLGRLQVPRRSDLPSALGIGLLQLAGFFAFAHAAVAWVPAGRTAVLANATTIFIVPFSWFLGERMAPRRWLAAAIGLLGIAVLTNPWAIDWTDTRVLIGHALLVAAALSWSLAMIVVRRVPPRLSMFQLLPWCFAIASAALLPLVAAEASHGGFGTDPAGWAALAYIGLVAEPLGTWCILQATATLPLVVSSIGFLAGPATGLILANLMLGEPFTPDLVIGAALSLAGAGLAAWPSRRGAPR
jgi:O-acetylserine/cysteine efflux transporter